MKITKYYTYKIVNLINKKYYIGRHIDNGRVYRGSGTALKSAYNKYGEDAFVFGILYYYDSEEEMIQGEKDIVTRIEVKNNMCYNLTEGGNGGIKGFSFNENSKLKMSKSRKLWIKNHPHFQDGEKNPMWRKGKRGKDNPMYGKIPWNKGLTKETDDRVKRYAEKAKLHMIVRYGKNNPNYRHGKYVKKNE